MICHRCLLRLSRRNVTLRNARSFSRSPTLAAQPVTAEVTQANNPRPGGKPAATSTSAAQPFGERGTYAPEAIEDLPIQRNQSKQPLRVQSSVPAGTVLKGLNFMKGKQDPIALEDDEYPEWLWGVLEKRIDGAASGKPEEGDLFCKFHFIRVLAWA